MLNPKKLKTYASNFVAFCQDVDFPTARGIRRFGDVGIEEQLELLRALAPSLLAIARGKLPPRRRYYCEATKGFGKDLLLAMVVIWLLAFAPQTLLIQLAADDFEQASETTKQMKDLLRHNRLLKARLQIQNSKSINPTTESTAQTLTRDDTGSHGARPNLLAINEHSHFTDVGTLDTLLDNAVKMGGAGLTIICSNAHFAESPQFELREQYKNDPHCFFLKYAKPAPWLDEADLEAAEKRNSPSRYRRLFLGETDMGGGDFLEREDIDSALTQPGPMLKAPDPIHGWRFCAGLDIGVKKHRTSIVVLGAKSGSGRLRLASVKSWTPKSGAKVDLTEVRRCAIDLHRKFSFRTMLFDPHQAELLSQDLTRLGVPTLEFPFTGSNCNLMAESLLDVFKSKIVDLYDDPELTRDLRRINIVSRAWGYKLEPPVDGRGHGDTAMAMAICLPFAMTMANACAGGAPVITTGHSERNSSRFGVHVNRNPRSPRSGVFLDVSHGSGWVRM
jgi:phage terminase large subunit-like protein